MDNATSRVFMTGATGFVGRSIVEALGATPLRILSHRAKVDMGDRDIIEVVTGDVTDPSTLTGAIDGCDTVIHLVAIIEEQGDATFDSVIRAGTEHVVAEAKRAGVRRFILMSANGARNDPLYGYMHAKWAAEQAVMDSGMSWTIFRPSIIFGPGDGFINQLADVVRAFPIIPVVGDGKSLFQPVHVKDVADAYVRAATDEPTTEGNVYELGGPRAYTYEELLDVIAVELGKSRPKVHMPVGLMRGVVTLSSPLPKSLRPPVTTEQLKMLALDNSTPQSATAELIGREPAALEKSIGYIRH